jgi:hypothetical protein
MTQRERVERHERASSWRHLTDAVLRLAAGVSKAYDWPGCQVPYFSDFWR